MRRFPATLASLALLALAVWEIGALAQAARATAGARDWAAAAAAVRAGFREGDLVTFAPDWIAPVGRRWLGDLLRLEDAGRMDDARYARIWELSVRGARAPARAGETPELETSFGAVTLRRFARAPARVRFDLRPWSRLHEVDFAPRDCVALFLDAERRRRELEVPRAELGETLHVRAGLVDVAARKRNRAVGRVEVRVDGEVVTSGLVDEARGWSALPVARTAPGPHRLSFRAALDHERPPVDLRICVAAESRSAR